MATKNQPPQFDENDLKMPEDPLLNKPVHTTSLFPVILGVLVVLLLLLLAGLFYWGMLMKEPVIEVPTTTRPTLEENNEPESTNAEADAQVLQTLSTSDELGAIEADLESTNLESLESEMITIENELNAEAE